MIINPCRHCGGSIRLGATRISANRKRGVAHYIAHMTNPACDTTSGYSCAMLKPYPKADADTPWRQMVKRWNDENPAPTSTNRPPEPTDTGRAALGEGE